MHTLTAERVLHLEIESNLFANAPAKKAWRYGTAACVSPSAVRAIRHGLRATGARALERPRRKRELGRGAGVV
ncbi:hypothetical protein EBA01_21920 [Xanthomonas oryzae pv. oryzae]|nr:hypothetical protein C0L89_21930 [Xanthomonas oryzae pv. oryzae]AVU04447.1 hypothetical protein C0L90_21930 [Xanthomonas oryzae pv. oryzae]QBN26462.1 hypothetical protein EBA00_21580 [Xanthomonas oryzae pv. oryzae]QBN30088.1 hypothetical protein EBA01_21920 [Xanthomonas oryzae pv. oryzae]QBN33715.1 hypothetical protein EBA02_21875 [Xanthomonas oryzae pv. oryzae]